MFAPHTLRSLEFPPVLDIVARFAQSAPGREEILNLSPTNQGQQILGRLGEVKEAMDLIGEGREVRLEVLKDLRPLLVKARPEGSILKGEELVAVRDMLLLSHRVKEQLEEIPSSYLLYRRAQHIHKLQGLRERLEATLGSHGEILDHASAQLQGIRSEKGGIKARIRHRLLEILANPSLSRVFQEKTFTIRRDRYVLPVRSEYSGKIKGVVQDQSASGSTLYVEPLVVLELNNKLQRKMKEEEREEERILKECTASVRAHLKALHMNQQQLAQIDSIFARARFACHFGGSIPSVLEKGPLRLLRGYHPLLLEHKGKEKTVPLDLTMGEKFHTLVITGPNTGGKTVALKTVGLLCLMAQSGIPPTAHTDSQFPVFHHILADIGDEQSIEQNLSTFSSHMKNILEILATADDHTLVLLDELGSGTDPWEGAPLAMTILEELHSKSTWTLASTHHNELKLYAHLTPRMENASMEFDPESLSPTFRLAVGVPGKSNAFIVAEKLGIPAPIIERARGFQQRERREIEKVIEDLEHETIHARETKEALEREKKKFEEELKRLQEEKISISQEKERSLMEGRRLLASLHREVKRLSKELKKDKNLRNVQVGLRRMEHELNALEAPEERKSIQIGDHVRVWGLGLKGTIASMEDDKAMVDTGKMKVLIPIDRLTLINRGEKREEPKGERFLTYYCKRERGEIHPEINFIGKRVEEVLPELEKFLDDLYLAGLSGARIIHGVGEGILKRAIREYLSTSPLVAGYQEASQQEGGAGATIVQLKTN